MATSVLGKLGEKAKKFSADVNSLLPEDVEKTALDEKQKNVDDYQSNYAGEKHSGGGLPVLGESSASPQDKINRHYGDRPGEKVIDTKPMLKPLGEGQPSTPLYDEGGDVDAGGKDKHQLAVLQDGEKVLTPDEAAQYKADQALKANPTEEAENRPPATPSKEMQDAQKKVDNPGAQTTQPVPQPEQLPTASHEERVAIKKDQQDAMGKGVNGLVGLGMANIHAKQLGLPGVPFKIDDMKAPEGLNQGAQGPSAGEQAAPAAPAGLPTIGGTDQKPAAPAAPAPDGYNNLDFKAKLEKLKQDHAAALHERTPQGKVKADYIQDEINQLHKDNPWGSKDNHPGILGKLGHVAAKVGNIAGDVLAPGLMGLVPGTDLNNIYENRVHSEQEDKDVTGLAAIDKAAKSATGNWKLSTSAVGPNGRAVLENSLTGETKEAPEGYTPYDKPVHEGDQAQYMNQWYKDHPDAVKSTANDDKAIEAYGAAKSAAGQENKAKGKLYYYNTPTGRKAYTYADAKAKGLNPGEDGMAVNGSEAEKDREKNVTYKDIQGSLQQYQKHVGKGDLQPKDINVLTAITEEADSPDWASKFLAGVFDDLLGHPVTGYSETLMKGTLTKNQYQDLSPAGRQVLADYYTTMMAHFANMKATQGTIPRNPAIIQNEMHTIPKPYLNAEEAGPTFQNYLDRVAMRNSNNVDFGDDKKEKPEGGAQGPKVGDVQEHQGFKYVFDGTHYVKQQ